MCCEMLFYRILYSIAFAVLIWSYILSLCSSRIQSCIKDIADGCSKALDYCVGN